MGVASAGDVLTGPPANGPLKGDVGLGAGYTVGKSGCWNGHPPGGALTVDVGGTSVALVAVSGAARVCPAALDGVMVVVA